MKKTLLAITLIGLYGCATQQTNEQIQPITANHVCAGEISLPEKMASKFEETEDNALLSKALGSPENGKLCQGKVYKSKKETKIIVYRAWNSTNPHSQLGNWWAWEKPTGKVAKYRSDYEICYQWSPIDTLVSCTLKPNTKVVVGTGQSAKCSQYLTYPVSSKQQIYIENAQTAVTECKVFHDVFHWK